MQKFVSAERLKECLYEEFMTRVNEVGVDLNFAVDHYHYQTMVQFVCGLGPRKGDALLKVRFCYFIRFLINQFLSCRVNDVDNFILFT